MLGIRRKGWRAELIGASLCAVLCGLMNDGLGRVTWLVAAEPRKAGRDKREPEAAVPVQLIGPTVGKWRLPRPPDDREQVKLELRLLPRGIPRHRFVGPATLAATGDSTWIEFIQGKPDQVLKLKVDCQWDEHLRVTVTPHFQLTPHHPVWKLSEATALRAQQLTMFTQLRVERQLQWLEARSGGKGKVKGGGPITMAKQALEQQRELTKLAQQRLDRLKELHQKLDGATQLAIRALHAGDGRSFELEPVAVDDSPRENRSHVEHASSGERGT